MATRLYLHSQGLSPISPTFGAWTRTVGAVRRLHHTAKEGTPNANFTLTKGDATDPANVLMYQYISRPLRAQTIAGNLKGIIQALSNTPLIAAAQMLVTVMARDLTTVRGTLLAFDVSVLSNTFDSVTMTNRKFPRAWTGSGAALSSVAALDTDLLVVEIGARMVGVVTTVDFTLRAGDDPALADLAENETDTADGTPWLEFSQTLLYLSETAPVQTFPSPGGVGYEVKDGNDYAAAPVQTAPSPGGVSYSVGGETITVQPTRFYKLLASNTVVGYITWINTTGDNTGRPEPGGVTGDTIIMKTWLE
jgi:hypothetical protein